MNIYIYANVHIYIYTYTHTERHFPCLPEDIVVAVAELSVLPLPEVCDSFTCHI